MINIVELTYTETERQSVGKAICEVLGGSIDVAWIRGVGDGVICDEIASRFHKSLNARPRKDDVPGTMVGESHYFKKPNDYYARCMESMASVDALFEVGKIRSNTCTHWCRSIVAACCGQPDITGARHCIRELLLGKKCREQSSCYVPMMTYLKCFARGTRAGRSAI